MIVVLGASGGIGSGLLQPLSMTAGCQIFGSFRDNCDVSDEDSVRDFFANLNKIDVEPGGPLYVINATGCLVNGMAHKYSDDDLDRTLDVNVAGAYRVAKHFRIAAEHRPDSSLLMLSSVVGRLGVPGASAYGAAKSAIRGMVRCLAPEFVRVGARVNAIEMGYFDTGMINDIPGDKRERILFAIPQGRFGNVAELASLSLEVLRNRYMTGGVVPITGGL